MSGKGHMTCKVYLHNFCSTYAAFLTMSVLEKPNAFIFALVFMKSLSEELYTKTILIYENEGEVCCCCLKCLKTIKKRIYFSEENEGYFDELKKILTEYYYV